MKFFKQNHYTTLIKLSYHKNQKQLGTTTLAQVITIAWCIFNAKVKLFREVDQELQPIKVEILKVTSIYLGLISPSFLTQEYSIKDSH